MAKFEVDMEIQGFKLRIKGDRQEDIGSLRNHIGQQVAGMLPAVGVMEDPPQRRAVESISSPANGSDTNLSARSRSGRRRRKSTGEGVSSSQTINWQHDPEKWGTPKQDWKGANKTLWTLYVIKKETEHTQVSATQIANTFNGKFKQFGPLNVKSMSNYLASLKTSSPTFVMDDTTKSPIEWYLTDAGTKAAEQLVQEAKATSTGAGS